jgi:hypothetical protein
VRNRTGLIIGREVRQVNEVRGIAGTSRGQLSMKRNRQGLSDTIVPHTDKQDAAWQLERSRAEVVELWKNSQMPDFGQNLRVASKQSKSAQVGITADSC